MVSCNLKALQGLVLKFINKTSRSYFLNKTFYNLLVDFIFHLQSTCKLDLTHIQWIRTALQLVVHV